MQMLKIIITIEKVVWVLTIISKPGETNLRLMLSKCRNPRLHPGMPTYTKKIIKMS